MKRPESSPLFTNACEGCHIPSQVERLAVTDLNLAEKLALGYRALKTLMSEADCVLDTWESDDGTTVSAYASCCVVEARGDSYRLRAEIIGDLVSDDSVPTPASEREHLIHCIGMGISMDAIATRPSPSKVNETEL